jgi:hypothetical protein
MVTSVLEEPTDSILRKQVSPNTDNYLQDYMASEHRKPKPIFSLP